MQTLAIFRGLCESERWVPQIAPGQDLKATALALYCREVFEQLPRSVMWTLRQHSMSEQDEDFVVELTVSFGAMSHLTIRCGVSVSSRERHATSLTQLNPGTC